MSKKNAGTNTTQKGETSNPKKKKPNKNKKKKKKKKEEKRRNKEEERGRGVGLSTNLLVRKRTKKTSAGQKGGGLLNSTYFRLVDKFAFAPCICLGKFVCTFLGCWCGLEMGFLIVHLGDCSGINEKDIWEIGKPFF